MPINIPNTTATTVYQYFGTSPEGQGGVYASGYIFCANGLVDVLLYHGIPGSQSPVGPFTVSTGLTPLGAGFHPGGAQIKDPVSGIGVRAANGAVSAPPQQFFGALFEPGIAALQTGSPFTGTLSSSGTISPVAAFNVIDYAEITANVTGITGVNFAGASAVVTGNALVYNGATVDVEFFAQGVLNSVAGDKVFFNISDGGNDLGTIGGYVEATASGRFQSLYCKYPKLPIAAGTHQLEIVAYVNAGAGSVQAGPRGANLNFPTWMQVSQP